MENAKTMVEAVKMVKKGSSRNENYAIHKKLISIKNIKKETSLYYQGMEYNLVLFNNESSFEKFFCENSKLFLGENNYYIDAKHKIQTKGFNAIPDGFLLDLGDENNPIIYIVEIEISTHNFNHIAAHIVKYNNLILKNQKEIIEIVSGYITPEVRQKTISHISFGILIIIDKEDAIIEPLIEVAPKGFSYKIISIESYNKPESNDIIFVKSEFYKETTRLSYLDEYD